MIYIIFCFRQYQQKAIKIKCFVRSLNQHHNTGLSNDAYKGEIIIGSNKNHWLHHSNKNRNETQYTVRNATGDHVIKVINRAVGGTTLVTTAVHATTPNNR